MKIKRLQQFLWLFLIQSTALSTGFADVRPMHNYEGTVVFDRWGGCLLSSGDYAMYVSEKVRQNLLPYDGKAIQVKAAGYDFITDSGDIRIAPGSQNGIYPASLRLKTFPAFQKGIKPSIIIEIINVSKRQLQIASENLAPILLTKVSPQSARYAPQDSPSFALITNQKFWISGKSRWGSSGMEKGHRYTWNIGESQALPQYFVLKKHQKRQIKISFDLPEGEYDFLCAYNPGFAFESASIVSNRIAFDLDIEGNITNLPDEQPVEELKTPLSLEEIRKIERSIPQLKAGMSQKEVNSILGLTKYTHLSGVFGGGPTDNYHSIYYLREGYSLRLFFDLTKRPAAFIRAQLCKAR
jgi:hypothetical protein